MRTATEFRKRLIISFFILFVLIQGTACFCSHTCNELLVKYKKKDHISCYNGDLYWYDNCHVPATLYRDCTNKADCVNFETPKPCIPEFGKTYGGECFGEGLYGGLSSAQSVFPDEDGNFIVLGQTTCHKSGGFGSWIIKLNKSGKLLWDKLIPFKDINKFYEPSIDSISPTKDNGIIICSMKDESGLLWVINLNAVGERIWKKYFRAEKNQDIKAIPSRDGDGFIVLFETGAHKLKSNSTKAVKVVKYDLNLKVVSSNIIDDTADNIYFTYVKETKDGGFIFAGYKEDKNVAMVRTSAEGDVIWTQTHNEGKPDSLEDIKETTDSGFILSGFTRSTRALDADVWLLKLDSNGSTMWMKTYGSKEKDDAARAVEQTDDGGYVVTGFKSFPDTSHDLLVMKLDSLGNTLWSQTYGGSDYDNGFSIHTTADGGYITAGRTCSYSPGDCSLWALKLNGKGENEW